ncbi:hypothetical protein EJ08DRAFT_655741 [Tothia fuscella]|uniref:Uncharacterized protein n=1 Tax=Tothia fuscella TaxID=1048955 RepID=A0A9P4U3W8_9PEZI|nr:hypothetical protein EJ08DRAFT_655741 [Tothia fuscella]
MPFYQSNSRATESWPHDIDIMGLPTSIYSPFQIHTQKEYTAPASRAFELNEMLPWVDSALLRMQSTVVYAEVYSPDDSSSPFSSTLPSRSSSIKSTTSSNTSTSESDTPTSPTQPLFPLFPSPWNAQFSRVRPNLKRKRSPHENTLRQLREKCSEADLKKSYEKQTLSYLDGSVFITPDSESSSVPAFRLLLTAPE